jgi:hypothetical protein
MSYWWAIIALLAFDGLVPVVDTPLRNFSRQLARRRFRQRRGANGDV